VPGVRPDPAEDFEEWAGEPASEVPLVASHPASIGREPQEATRVSKQDDQDPELPFDRLGDYEVLAPIEEGGMGSVWLGRPIDRPAELVALKAIRAEYGRNKDFVAMLVDEAGIASRLSHPHILAVRALGHDGTRHFLVMELLRGHTLLEAWKAAHTRGKRIPFELAAWIGARIADALHYAHELTDEGGAPLQVVHRDVNPANIFLTSEGVPKLIDFGLAKARDRIATTAMGVVKGKLAYLSPEQSRGKPADRRSDIFALGVTLWEISLDRRLFQEDSDVETVRRVRETQVPDPTTILEGYPPALAKALLRALASEPDDRWETAAQLRDALDAFVQSAGGVDASNVRALAADIFAGQQSAAWERIADEVKAEQERTRVWEERKEMPTQETPHMGPLPPKPRPPLPYHPLHAGVSPRLATTVAACSVAGAFLVLVAVAARGCRGRDANGGIEQRVARIESILGIVDAGPAAAGSAASIPSAAGGVVSADDERPGSGACALAKIGSYQVWQEAFAKAKTNAGPAEAACAEMWSESRKQACYRAATVQVRGTQAARDAAIAGGGRAREAVAAVKDDAKNEAIARARAASQAAFAACGDEDGGA
jgi:serine/threonine protein kinase